MFETLAASPWPTGARDAKLAHQVSGYWVRFARTGSPNGKGEVEWPQYGADARLLNFTNDGPVAQPTPDAAPLDLITRRLDPPPAK